jgi:uncharacterized protein CbrC (UPF0167 family)
VATTAPGAARPVVAGEPPWKSWGIEEWLAHRDHAAAYLATDPGWLVGPAVVAHAEWHARRLGWDG